MFEKALSPSRRTVLAAAGGAFLPWGTEHARLEPPGSPWRRLPEILHRIDPPRFPHRTFRITDYGAVGDDATDCTDAFRRAVWACHRSGGGRVVVPSGTFRTGAIHLRSKVNLHLAMPDSTIRFSTDPAAFPPVFTRWQGIECVNFSPFIYSYGQRDLAVTGVGTIDGNAQNGPWFGYDPQRYPDWDALQQMAVDGVPPDQRVFGAGHFLKPNMIQFYRCRNVLVQDVRIVNPAMWAIHPVLSRNVTVRGVSVHSRGGMVDGCDPESSAYVHITGCSFDTGDDGTVIKSGRDTDGRRVGVPSEKIVIEDNDYYGRWGAVTVGSEMSGGVRDVFAQDCRIHPGEDYKAFYALYLKTNKRRGGVIDGIHVRRITGGPVTRGCVYVDMNYSLTGPGFGDIVFPVIQNIDVERMTLDSSPYAFRIDGLAERPLRHFHVRDSAFTGITDPTIKISNAEDVTFSNVTINGVPVPGSGS